MSSGRGRSCIGNFGEVDMYKLLFEIPLKVNLEVRTPPRLLPCCVAYDKGIRIYFYVKIFTNIV